MPKRRNKNLFPVLIPISMIAILICGFLYIYLFKKPIIISPIGTKNSVSSEIVRKLLLEAKIPFSEISIATDSSYLVRLNDGSEVFLSPKDTSLRIQSLQALLKQFTIEGQKFKRVDFRFEKPTIIF
ncbi:MAG: cell division protein FtsQ/DivIB [Candidatus Levybacteria bacterium]|nr:cell division protein FtsQ/DivIB [Candidatus Levybacteria bacterium]